MTRVDNGPADSRGGRRRISTKYLGAFAAVAAPAALMAAPGVADAGFYRLTYFQGCMTYKPGYVIYADGPNRTPYSMADAVAANYNCIPQASNGFVSTNIFETYNNARLAHASIKDGYAHAGPITTRNTLELYDQCDHYGYHHSHILSCSSSRSTG